MVVKPFLSHNSTNSTTVEDANDEIEGSYDIRTIYPVLAGVAGLFALAFLFIGFYTRSTSGHQELLKPAAAVKNQDDVSNTQTCEKTPFRKVERVLFVCLVTAYLFLFTGLEAGFIFEHFFSGF